MTNKVIFTAVVAIAAVAGASLMLIQPARFAQQAQELKEQGILEAPADFSVFNKSATDLPDVAQTAIDSVMAAKIKRGRCLPKNNPADNANNAMPNAPDKLQASMPYKTESGLANVSPQTEIPSKTQTIHVTPPRPEPDEVDKRPFVLLNRPMESPLHNIRINPTTFTVPSGDKPVTFSYKTGSIIQVPAHAFVDSKGRPYSGKAFIKYREFHTPVDLILSGIPMNYDSSGYKSHFETAGMFEIYAFTPDDKPLSIAPNKSIKVDMVTNNADHDFNFYTFNQAAMRWQYTQPSPIPQKKQVSKGERLLLNLESELPLTRFNGVPVRYALVDDEQHGQILRIVHIPNSAHSTPLPSIDLKIESFQDFKLESIQTAPNLQQVVSWIDTVEQVRGSVVYKAGESYDLTLRRYFEEASGNTFADAEKNLRRSNKAAEFIVLRCKPLLNVSKGEQLKDLADKRFYQYHMSGDVINKVVAERRTLAYHYATKRFKEKTINKQDQDLLNLRYAAEQKRRETETLLFRTTSLSSFGLYNHDRVFKSTARVPINAEFKFRKTNTDNLDLSMVNIYTVYPGSNAVFSFPLNQAAQSFYLLPDREVMLFAVLPNNRLAVFPKSRLKSIAIETLRHKNFTFDMKTLDLAAATPDDLKHMLDIQ